MGQQGGGSPGSLTRLQLGLAGAVDSSEGLTGSEDVLLSLLACLAGQMMLPVGRRPPCLSTGCVCPSDMAPGFSTVNPPGEHEVEGALSSMTQPWKSYAVTSATFWLKAGQ